MTTQLSLTKSFIKGVWSNFSLKDIRNENIYRLNFLDMSTECSISYFPLSFASNFFLNKMQQSSAILKNARMLIYIRNIITSLDGSYNFSDAADGGKTDGIETFKHEHG